MCLSAATLYVCGHIKLINIPCSDVVDNCDTTLATCKDLKDIALPSPQLCGAENQYCEYSEQRQDIHASIAAILGCKHHSDQQITYLLQTASDLRHLALMQHFTAFHHPALRELETALSTAESYSAVAEWLIECLNKVLYTSAAFLGSSRPAYRYTKPLPTMREHRAVVELCETTPLPKQMLTPAINGVMHNYEPTTPIQTIPAAALGAFPQIAALEINEETGDRSGQIKQMVLAEIQRLRQEQFAATNIDPATPVKAKRRMTQQKKPARRKAVCDTPTPTSRRPRRMQSVDYTETMEVDSSRSISFEREQEKSLVVRLPIGRDKIKSFPGLMLTPPRSVVPIKQEDDAMVLDPPPQLDDTSTVSRDSRVFQQPAMSPHINPFSMHDVNQRDLFASAPATFRQFPTEDLFNAAQPLQQTYYYNDYSAIGGVPDMQAFDVPSNSTPRTYADTVSSLKRMPSMELYKDYDSKRLCSGRT